MYHFLSAALGLTHSLPGGELLTRKGLSALETRIVTWVEGLQVLLVLVVH